MKRLPATVLTLYIVALALLAIGVVLHLMGAAYDRGVEAGMRDLCGEIGGTWDDTDHGYCDTPKEG